MNSTNCCFLITARKESHHLALHLIEMSFSEIPNVKTIGITTVSRCSNSYKCETAEWANSKEIDALRADFNSQNDKYSEKPNT
ncbi:hypothetical protein X798_02167 [Onchocerca flexuosa]|uniref:DUF1273 family protein n=2 Tax=Onchocerca flexuosa TaxID=387005 RepID=A0A183I1L8_9BILA|nr:hypothetical protein X798_02167 [Onchocerca flexuosa]VDP14248.1 unnamed protein product [Onchocerca flexuosa]